jgi:predicted metal-dependent hydrolase
VFRDGLVEIVVPLRARPAQIEQFVARHRQWIEQTERRARLAAAASPQSGRRVLSGALPLPATGEHWLIEHRAAEGRPRLRVKRAPQTARCDGLDASTVTAPAGRLLLQAGAEDQAGLRNLLVGWLRERMRSVGELLLPPLARSMGVDFTALRIGVQRSRWGSCSRQGTISLNCCLLFQRAEVLRYLLVHELAHRRHMNHGMHFWRLVERHEPQWRALDRELSTGWRRVPGWVLAGAETGQ